MTGEGWIGHWSPGIGDPSVMGWITVVAYFSASWLCWRARRTAKNTCPRDSGSSALLWGAFSVGLLLLGINKQLDLQTALTEEGRILAHAHGWYAQRHTVQLAFIVTIAVAGAVGFLLLLVAARHEFRRMFVALVGITELGCFVLIRASSFHHVDRFINYHVFGVRMNWVMELGGVALVALGAILYSGKRY